MTLFLIFMVSAMLMNVLQTSTLQLAITRNSIEYERALYLANAGVHHACALITADPAWRGAVTDGTVPPASPASGYSATAADNGLGGVVVLSTGYAGRGVRTVEATIDL